MEKSPIYEPPLSDWPQYCDEVSRGMTEVRELLTKASPQPSGQIIEVATAKTGLCRGRVINAIAELIDDRVIRRTDGDLDELEYVET